MGLGVARKFWKDRDGWWDDVDYFAKVTALSAWYREFDPVNRKLKGVLGILTEGDADLEACYLPEEHSFNTDQAIIKGVGMGLNGNDYEHFAGMKIKVGNIVENE